MYGSDDALNSRRNLLISFTLFVFRVAAHGLLFATAFASMFACLSVVVLYFFNYPSGIGILAILLPNMSVIVIVISAGGVVGVIIGIAYSVKLNYSNSSAKENTNIAHKGKKEIINAGVEGLLSRIPVTSNKILITNNSIKVLLKKIPNTIVKVTDPTEKEDIILSVLQITGHIKPLINENMEFLRIFIQDFLTNTERFDLQDDKDFCAKVYNSMECIIKQLEQVIKCGQQIIEMEECVYDNMTKKEVSLDSKLPEVLQFKVHGRLYNALLSSIQLFSVNTDELWSNLSLFHNSLIEYKNHMHGDLQKSSAIPFLSEKSQVISA